MANIFTITTAQQTLKADASGSATTVFTVTNSTSRPLRGFVKIKPLSNTQAQWLKVEGEAERDFPAGGTHQFTVAFNKPKPGTPPSAPQPAESFPFRLDAISAINPDEDFTEGPLLTVEIPEQTVEPKKSFPWWIPVVIAVLVVGVIVAVLLLRDKGDNNENTATPTPTATATATATPTATPTPMPTLPPPPTPIKIRPRITLMSPKEYGKDRPGSDFQYFVAPTLQDCENACKENAACKAFTFGNGNNCWLKNAKPASVDNPKFISGTKIE
jgi:hypothetical protein